MRISRSSRLAAAVCLGTQLIVGVLVADVASAAEHGQRHCVVKVIAEEDGQIVTGEERCSSNYAEARAFASEAFGAAEASTNTVGVHFTGTNFSGSSITIVGTICSGGVWYPTGGWNNNIDSSYHYCGSKPTIFYDSSSCSGTSRAIYGSSSTLFTMNDRASCVRYG